MTYAFEGPDRYPDRMPPRPPAPAPARCAAEVNEDIRRLVAGIGERPWTADEQALYHQLREEWLSAAQPPDCAA